MTRALFGYGTSVYSQIARMALAELDLSAQWHETDPFEGTGPNPHPFGLVPLLRDDGVEVYETTAILHYLDATYGAQHWSGGTPIEQTRIRQVQAIADHHAYWPLVRQVFGHAVFRPAHGLVPDDQTLQAGLAAADPVLRALDRIAAEGHALTGQTLTQADLHLGPMVGFFAAAPQGCALLARFSHLSAWFDWIKCRPSYRDTCPPLSAVHD